MIEINKIYNQDCLIGSDNIESGSVDLILTDLPYGTVENLGDSENIKHGMKNKTSWDIPIPPEEIHRIANRILRKNGKMILFSQNPYTTKLINSALPNLPHCYNMIWEKDHFANSLIAKKAPVNFYEEILVFSKTHDIEGLHPLREYFKNVMEFIGLKKKQIVDMIGQKADHTFRINSTQYGLCTEKTYHELINVFSIDKMDGFKLYEELRHIDKKYDSTFNLWEGKKYKSNILKYKKDYDGLHPAQKPVLLLEDLIKTFSNEGDLVVDLTIGSGSTMVACLNTNRKYIGYELNEEYYNTAKERINNHIITNNLQDTYDIIS